MIAIKDILDAAKLKGNEFKEEYDSPLGSHYVLIHNGVLYSILKNTGNMFIWKNSTEYPSMKSCIFLCIQLCQQLDEVRLLIKKALKK